nr:unnamed protein product [Callosobruchus analis]
MSAEEETLVGLVSKYESLYDMSNKNYSNSEMKDNIWQQIGEQMNWSGQVEKIKDNFRKAIKARKTKSGKQQKKIGPGNSNNRWLSFFPILLRGLKSQTLIQHRKKLVNPVEKSLILAHHLPLRCRRHHLHRHQDKIKKYRQVPPPNVGL